MFSIKPKTLYYWYQVELSGYKKEMEAGRWEDHKIQIADKDSGEVKKEKPVPIAKPDNMGSRMTVDEKQIGKRMYTIMTYAKTGKIALLTQSMKPEELKQAVKNYLSQKNRSDKICKLRYEPFL